jgi:ferric-dicitrate binding protein FerR (iron transport regulator)
VTGACRGIGAWRLLAVVGLLVSLVGASLTPSLSPAALGQAASGATLNVLAASVEVAIGGAAFAAARDGMTLGPGDQVRTSGGGVGLLTFFDGSELQLTPDSQVQINQASSTAGPTINVSQILGTTVDRVQRLTA